MKKKILIVEDELIVASDIGFKLRNAGYEVTGIAQSVESALEMITWNKPDLVILDIFLKGPQTGIDLANHLNKQHIAFIYLSANSNQEVLNAAKKTSPYGFLVKPFREKDLLVTLDIANFRHESYAQKSTNEAEILSNLLNANADNQRISLQEKVKNICIIIQPYIPFDYLITGFIKPDDVVNQDLNFLRIAYNEYQIQDAASFETITKLDHEQITSLKSRTHYDVVPRIYNHDGFDKLCKTDSLHKVIMDRFNVRSNLQFPLALFPGNKIFSFCFYSKQSDAYLTDHVELLSRIQKILIKIVEGNLTKIKPNNEIPIKKQEGINLLKPLPVDNFGIIGSSYQLLNVLDKVKIIAPEETSVLILGESGTGKERIATSIHHLSRRYNMPFIVVNCSALPALLIESELFGHEKGSFTGATEKRIGKFEQADGGTIFLDEIGEIPIELQTKFLRVLQEREIERVGGKAPIRVNVRVIAATNRILEKEIAFGRFRLDLYYRLYIFPILMPPLRERKEDIPALVAHFLDCNNKKSNKTITGISSKALNGLMNHHWPGNIRELEHAIERNYLLSKSEKIDDIQFPEAYKTEPDFKITTVKTIQENERDYIIDILKQCNGRIWGAGGAAELLNLPPTTLASKIKKLGIKKEFF